MIKLLIALTTTVLVTATIKPWYELHQEGNNLMIDTNMQVYKNGEKCK